MALNKGIWDRKLRGTNIKGTNLKTLICIPGLSPYKLESPSPSSPASLTMKGSDCAGVDGRKARLQHTKIRRTARTLRMIRGMKRTLVFLSPKP